MSLSEYDRLIATGAFDWPTKRRVELIEGEIRDMNPIGPAHEETVDFMNRWSIQSLPTSVRVRVQNSIGLPSLISVPEPDLAWVAEKSYAKSRPLASDVLLVIEV